jgi:hypothetical protein
VTDAEALIGRRIDDVAWSVVTSAGVPAVEEIDGRIYVQLPSAGLSAVADEHAVIFAVQLHAEDREGYVEFRGDLPRGLRFDMSRDAARAHLGPPTSSGEGADIHPFGRTTAWDRWDFPDAPAVHCEYGHDDASIRMVSLLSTRG